MVLGFTFLCSAVHQINTSYWPSAWSVPLSYGPSFCFSLPLIWPSPVSSTVFRRSVLLLHSFEHFMTSSVVNKSKDKGKLYAICFFTSERTSVCGCVAWFVRLNSLIDNGREPIGSEYDGRSDGGVRCIMMVVLVMVMVRMVVVVVVVVMVIVIWVVWCWCCSCTRKLLVQRWNTARQKDQKINTLILPFTATDTATFHWSDSAFLAISVVLLNLQMSV